MKMRVWKKMKENELFRDIIWITIVYFAAHWFLLIASGRWWDDWVYADKNWEYLYEVMRQSSVPLTAVLDASLWLFPDGFYRILVFFIFYIGAIVFYFILKKLDIFRTQDRLWIVLLFVTIPVNDARILWICYPYTVGFCLFLFSFLLAIVWYNSDGKKRIILRIISLVNIILAYSFLQSTMMLTLLILFYFYYEEIKAEWRWKEVKNNIKKLLLAVLRYLDYLFAPIVWYFGSKLLFPGYGAYGGVYYISWRDLPGIIRKSPVNAFVTMMGILKSYFGVLDSYRLAVVSIFFIIAVYVILLMIRKRKHNDEAMPDRDFKYDLVMDFLGLAAFFFAYFPYAVHRRAPAENIYTDGRATVLLGIGMAIFLYYGFQIIFRKKIIKIALISFVALGIFHFNYIYQDWQEAYYQQVQLQHAIVQDEGIRDNDTFLIMYKGDMVSACYYQTVGNSYAATGEETRYYMRGTAELSSLIEMDGETWYLDACGIKDYDYNDKTIDGIIFVDYADIGRWTLMKQKLNEIFHKDAFNSWIDEIKNIKYVSITKEESDKLLDLYSAGELNDDMIYGMYY